MPHQPRPSPINTPTATATSYARSLSLFLSLATFCPLSSALSLGFEPAGRARAAAAGACAKLLVNERMPSYFHSCRSPASVFLSRSTPAYETGPADLRAATAATENGPERPEITRKNASY